MAFKVPLFVCQEQTAASLRFALLRCHSFCYYRFAAVLFQACLWGWTGSEVLSRHRRAWIIASFTVEEEEPEPFPHLLGTVRLVNKILTQFHRRGWLSRSTQLLAFAYVPNIQGRSFAQ